MFNQTYFDDLFKIIRGINKIWKPLDGKNLIGYARLNIFTRDGKRFSVRFNPGSIYTDPDILHVVVYDDETDESHLVSIPFHTIERVEVFDSKPGAAGKKVGFETAKQRQSTS